MDYFPNKKPILVVMGLALTSRLWVPALLMDGYDVKLPQDMAQLMQTLSTPSSLPSLILLTSQMPGTDRTEIITQLKRNPKTWNIPVVIFGWQKTEEDELLAFEQGATDFFELPMPSNIFRARIRARLAQNGTHQMVQMVSDQLEAALSLQTAEMNKVKDVTIMAMTALAQTRDAETGNHICRTQHYVRALSLALRTHPRFRHFLTTQNIDILFKSAPLHDLGKIGIPDRILLKPGKFNADEMEIMKTHTTLGRDAIEYAESLLGHGRGFLSVAKEIAYSHQEKWDGSGYPQGLAGDAIPVSARLMAVADVYDAVISRRVYKPGMPHEKAVKIILIGKGRHFDPDIVDAFLSIVDEFKAISVRFADTDLDIQEKADYVDLALEGVYG
jgi:putative two-component system response regulator